MRHFTVLLLLLLSFNGIMAQNAQSNAFSYQATARDANGDLLADQTINVQLALRFGDTSGTADYIENHTATTNSNGVFSLKIGDGTLVAGAFDPTAWGTDASYLTINVNGVEVGTTEILAVPYALSALNSEDNLWELNEFGETVNVNQSVPVGIFGGMITDVVVVQNALTFNSGVPISAFSDNGALGTSDSVVPTENAVKTYVDNQVAAVPTGATSLDDLSDVRKTATNLLIGNPVSSIGSNQNSTSVGVGAMSGGSTNTLPFQNTAVGFRALSNATSDSNTAVGARALEYLTTGQFNIGIGFGSLQDLTTGAENVAIGYAGRNMTTGSRNTLLGRRGLWNNVTGNDNVTVGYEAGYNELGSNKLHIANTRNRTLIYGEFDNRLVEIDGALTATGNSNSNNADIILGGTSNTAAGDDGIIASDPAYAGSDIFLRSNDAIVMQLDSDENESGDFEIVNGAGTRVFNVSESGNVTVNGSTVHSSDRRLKKDIESLPYGLDEVLQLQPSAYNWKSRETKHKSLGLIAQEVQNIIPNIVSVGEDEQQLLAVSYTELIPVLIKAIQEQQLEIEQLRTEKAESADSLAQMNNRLNRLEQMVSGLSSSTGESPVSSETSDWTDKN